MKVHDQLGFAPGRLDRITEHLQRNYIDPQKIAGCQVLVARGGEIVYANTLGRADRERDKPMRDDTIFRLYSMTKPITSVALMTLYEQGRFQLKDSVTRWLPEWEKQQVWVSGEGESMVTEAPRRPVTIRDMLCHTGGITYGNALASLGVVGSGHPVEAIYERLRVRREREETLSDFVHKLAGVPLRYQPGERWMYSYSTDVCGALVEVISGQRFDRYLKEHIFEPLG
ncbi:MAG TPA: serine hydrolase domain-containing protein, partial [Polyangiales bacterium]|nr:serine hydrolase domain-containing protein [Polyangiales bacterium]